MDLFSSFFLTRRQFNYRCLLNGIDTTYGNKAFVIHGILLVIIPTFDPFLLDEGIVTLISVHDGFKIFFQFCFFV